MTIRCSVFVAASVDGFIATRDGGIEWLDRPEYATTPMQGLTFEKFMSTVDALVMGRKTFEKVVNFQSWPYDNMPVIVLSSKDVVIPTHLQEAVLHTAGKPKDIVARLSRAGMTHLYIDGGVTIQQFLRDELIDEIIITRIPVLLGEGRPLFSATSRCQRLTLIDAVASENGFVQEHYGVEKV